MRCKAVLREIEEIEGVEPLSHEASRHVVACASCRAFLKERDSLRQMLGMLEAVKAPEDFDWKLRARLARERTETVRAAYGRALFAPGARAISLAATFALLVVAVVVYKQTRPQQISTLNREAAVAGAARTNNNATKAQTPAPEPTATEKQNETETASGTLQWKANEGETARGRNSRGVKTNGSRPEATEPSAQQPIFSNDFGSTPAQDLAIGKSLTDAGPVISVPMRTSGQPARLQLDDGLGTKRTLSLSPVTFGGQEVIERRDGARLVPTNAQGIW